MKYWLFHQLVSNCITSFDDWLSKHTQLSGDIASQHFNSLHILLTCIIRFSVLTLFFLSVTFFEDMPFIYSASVSVHSTPGFKTRETGTTIKLEWIPFLPYSFSLLCLLTYTVSVLLKCSPALTAIALSLEAWKPNSNYIAIVKSSVWIVQLSCSLYLLHCLVGNTV